MHKHRKIKGNSRFGSLCGPGRLFCFSMAKKRCLCYTCLSELCLWGRERKAEKREVRGVIRIAMVEDEAAVREQLMGYVQRYTRQY